VTKLEQTAPAFTRTHAQGPLSQMKYLLSTVAEAAHQLFKLFKHCAVKSRQRQLQVLLSVSHYCRHKASTHLQKLLSVDTKQGEQMKTQYPCGVCHIILQVMLLSELTNEPQRFQCSGRYQLKNLNDQILKTKLNTYIYPPSTETASELTSKRLTD